MNKKTEQKKFGLKDFWRGLVIIFGYTKDHRSGLWSLFALTIGAALLEAFIPTLWGKIVDSVISGAHINIIGYVVYGPVVMIGLWFCTNLASSFLEWQKGMKARVIEQKIQTSYTADAYGHLFRMPIDYHKTFKSGETTEKINRAAGGINDVFTSTLLNNLPDVLTTLVMFGIVLHINPLFGAIMGVGIAASVVVSLRELDSAAIFQREMQGYYKTARGLMSDAITNIKVVKDFATEKYEYERISSYYKEKAVPSWYKLLAVNRTASFLQSTIGLLVRLAVFSFSIYFVSKGWMTIGQIVALNAMVSLRSLYQLVNSRYRIQNSVIAIEEAEEILHQPIEAYEPANSAAKKMTAGRVVFDKVWFGYQEGKEVLRSISFTAEPGEVIALVGESGVGKSTLIDLLLGYYFPDKGGISLDGIDTREISLVELRKNVAVVTQEITLFNDSIRNNISYGSPHATAQMVTDAAVKAHCKDFIDKFPDGWEQLVGERGLKLSVGQKQRVAIARAILRDPKILILDEPTSALDAGSEKIITESLELLMRGKTTFIIAHRLSTVRKADKILVIKDGAIVEEGKHDELVTKKNGEYRKLHDLQIGLSA